jgi:hypothetical protein
VTSIAKWVLINYRDRDQKMTENYKSLLANMSEIFRLVETHRHDGFDSALATAKSLMADAVISGELAVVKSGLSAIDALEKELALLPDELRQRFCSSMYRAFTPTAKLLGMMPNPDPLVVREFIQGMIDQGTHPFDQLANLPAVVSKIPTDYETLGALLDFLISKSTAVEEAVRFHMGYPECIGDLIQHVVRSDAWPRPLAAHSEVFSEQQRLFLGVVAKNVASLTNMAETHRSKLMNIEKLSSLWGILVLDLALLFSLATTSFYAAAEHVYHYSAHRMHWRYMKGLAETGFLPSPNLVEKNLKSSLNSSGSKYWSTTLRFHFASHGVMPLPDQFFSLVYGDDVCSLINELCAASTADDVGVCLAVIDGYMSAQPKHTKIFSPQLPAFILEIRPDLETAPALNP